jgi:release factor glutamine methyltransferase
MDASVTLAALLCEGTRRLQDARGSADPTLDAPLDARILLAHVAALPQARLKSHPEQPVSARAAREYRALLERRAAGEPVAYLTGRREFWSLELAVTPEVLIPRPETELLVERALALGAPADARIADLGTGSGAIALALARERPRWRVTATDRSAAALAVAAANAQRLGLGAVEFRLGSWFEALSGSRFDLIISNPPYVAADDPVLTSPTLVCEPRQALTPGNDPLVSLRLLAREAPAHLASGGWLLLEHGHDQGPAVRHALVLAGFAHVRSHHDLAGHERMTEGQHGQI